MLERLRKIIKKKEEKKNWYWENTPNINTLGDNHYHIKVPMGMKTADVQWTNVILLDKEPDIILSEMDKDTRYEIRRAENKDVYDWKMHDAPTAQDLKAFLSVFKEFYMQKKLDVDSIDSFYIPELERRRTEGKLYLSEIYAEEIHIYHVYSIECKGRIRLTCSASVFRDLDKSLKAKNGRMNRLLHWKDILFFKERMFEIYDMGGLDLSGDSSVTKFKLGFSKCVEKRYHVFDTSKSDVCEVEMRYSQELYYEKIVNNVINQLSDKYIFYDAEKMRTRYQKAFEIDVEEMTESFYGVDPLEFYYLKQRSGELTYAILSENIIANEAFLEKYIITRCDSCVNNVILNGFDVIILTVENKIDVIKVLESMAAGCFPIVLKKNQNIQTDFIINEKNGFVIENISSAHELETVMDWCQTNLKYIRRMQPIIAEQIATEFMWENISKKWCTFIEEMTEIQECFYRKEKEELHN